MKRVALNPQDRKLVVLFPLYYLAFYLCRYSLLPVLPLLVEKNILEASQVGLVISALYMGYASTLIPAGILSQRYGAKRTVTIGALGSTLSNFLLTCVQEFRAILVFTFTNGVFQGLIWPSLMYLVSAKFSSDKLDYVVGSMLTAAIFGPSVVFFLAGILMVFYPRAVFYTFGLFLLLLTFIFYKNIEETSVNATTFIKEVFVNRNVWLLAASYMCFYAVVRGTLGWLPVIISIEASLSPSIASLVSSIYPLVGSFSAFTGTLLSKRALEKEQILVASFTLSILILLSLNKQNIVFWLIAFFFTISLSEWFFFTIPPSILPPESVGLASGIIDSMGYIGSSLGAATIGFMANTYGKYSTALKALTIFCLAGAVFSVILSRAKQPRISEVFKK